MHIQFVYLLMDIYGVKYRTCCYWIKYWKIPKSVFKAFINKDGNQENNNEREYLFSKEGVDISTELGTTYNYWSSFVSRGEGDQLLVENQIGKENKRSFGIELLAGITVIVVIVS